MHAGLLPREDGDDRFRQGMVVAIVLHLLVFAGIAAYAIWGHFHEQRLGSNESMQGAIQASMVSALPLPSKVPPVEKQVLAPQETSVAPTPPKDATQPPPKPTDIEVKAKKPPKAKEAPVPQPPPPKHTPPAPPTPKATMGESAMQLPTTVTQVGKGSATMTVMNRTFGSRFAYYSAIVQRKIGQNWYRGEADPSASAGRKVTLVFTIDRDGSPQNVRVLTPSGSPSLDLSATRALERIDTFGPLPGGLSSITVQDTFDYGQQ